MDTHCHREGGCIRAFDDDTCGEQGQCSIILAVLAEREKWTNRSQVQIPVSREQAALMIYVAESYLGPSD